MVNTMKNLPERAFADILFYFESVRNMVPYIAQVFAFVVVKATVFGSIRRLKSFSVQSFFSVYVVDLVEL